MTLDISSKLLKRIEPKTRSEWTLWEKKNLNIHRGLIELTASRCDSIHDLAREVRDGVRDEFRPGWFRGFGFGAILHLQDVPKDFAEICQHIDTRNRKGGVWQWAVVCLDQDKVAVAIHTWLHGYLRPVYDSVLLQLENDGYECHASDAEVDVLVAKLRKVADTCRTLQRLSGFLG